MTSLIKGEIVYHEELFQHSFFYPYHLVFCNLFSIKFSVDSTQLFWVVAQTHPGFSLGFDSLLGWYRAGKCFRSSRKNFFKERNKETEEGI